MLKTLISIFCLVIVSGVANADTKVKIRQTSATKTPPTSKANDNAAKPTVVR